MDLEQYKTVIKNLNLAIGSKPTYDQMQALLATAQHLSIEFPEELKTSLQMVKYAKSWAIPMYNESKEQKFQDFYWTCSLFESPHNFESFMEYMEKNRAPEKRFYAPRKKTLQVVAHDLQRLEDGHLDFLGVSLPARVRQIYSMYILFGLDNGEKTEQPQCYGRSLWFTRQRVL